MGEREIFRSKKREKTVEITVEGEENYELFLYNCYSVDSSKAFISTLYRTDFSYPSRILIIFQLNRDEIKEGINRSDIVPNGVMKS